MQLGVWGLLGTLSQLKLVIGSFESTGAIMSFGIGNYEFGFKLFYDFFTLCKVNTVFFD